MVVNLNNKPQESLNCTITSNDLYLCPPLILATNYSKSSVVTVTLAHMYI